MPLADIKKYFLWSTIAGCIWVVLSAFFGWQVFGVLGSIAFMLLYIAAYEKSSRETNSKAHLSTFANSLYFQGFLLTVWALIISLVVWGALRGVSITPGDVLSRIGIALVTTFIGLGGRTLYIQFYESAEDVERAAHHGLTEKSAQLAGELSASIHAIRTVRSEFVVEIESMRESIKSAKSDQEKSTIATAKLLAESFNKEVQTAITSIVDYQIKHSQDVAALTSSLGNASQQLEASAISLAKAGKAIQEINSVQHNRTEELLADQVKQITQCFESLTVEVLGRVGDIVEGLEAKITEFSIDDSAITEAVAASWNRFGSLAKEIENSAQVATKLIIESRNTLESVSTGMSDVSVLPGIVLQLSNALHSTANSVSIFKEGIDSLAYDIGSMDLIVAGAKGAVEETRHHIESLPIKLEAISEEIASRSIALQDKFEDSEEAVSKLLRAEIESINSFVSTARDTAEATKNSIETLPPEFEKLSAEITRLSVALQEQLRATEINVTESLPTSTRSMREIIDSVRNTLEEVKKSADLLPEELEKLKDKLTETSISLKSKLASTESAISEFNETLDQGAGLLAKDVSKK